jgi:hypothetical protein
MNIRATARILCVTAAALAAVGGAWAQATPANQPSTSSSFQELLGRMQPRVEPIAAAQIDEVGQKSGLTDCFWVGTLSPTTFNILGPDAGATYWISQYQLPAGARLQFRGVYPFARHASFNTYDDKGQPLDRINDDLIEPESRNGVNPFRAGAARDGANRNYQIEVASRELKAGSQVSDASRASNTLYAPSSGNVQIIYRVYVPDHGKDAKGGVPLPQPVMIRADGSKVEGEALCRDIVRKDGAVHRITVSADAQRDFYAMPGRSKFQPAQYEPKWDASFNFGLTASRMLIGTAYEPMRDKQDHTRRGALYSTLDNTYMAMYVDNRIGQVLVLEGKAPTTPRTQMGEKIMQAADLRYWSVCKYRSLADSAVDACLYDEQVPQDRNGRFIIALSAPGDRPGNARPDCGVAWMPWGTGDGAGNPHGGMLLWRQMLPSAEFRPHSIFSTTKLNEEQTVLGDYYPKPRYVSRAEFEKLGCSK